MTDIELDIATAHSHMAKQWKNKKVKWSDLVKRCKEPTITNVVMLKTDIARYLKI